MRTTLSTCCLFFTVFWLATSSVNGQSAWHVPVGWEALQSELGGALADGTGIDVCQVEAIENASGGYRPTAGAAEFLNPDKIFIDLSGINDFDSMHAFVVGRVFYGNSSSVVPGVINVFNYEATDFVFDAMGTTNSSEPDAQPFVVQNHSWIADTGITDSLAESILDRVDYIINRDNVCVVCGTGNSGTTPKLMATGFNSITVGRTIGAATGLTTFNIPGRVKPEIVAPHPTTSRATPMVGGAAVMLREAGMGTNAENSEAVKALILAGATKTEFAGWSRTSEIPLDTTFGAGELNIYNSYKMFLAGETDGQTSPPTVPTSESGWDFGTINAGQTMNYLIELDEPADHVSIVLTWNIEITDQNGSPDVFVPGSSLNDLDLIFAGNGLSDVSNSFVQNIEHVYLRDVPAGTYSIIVTTSDTTDFGLAWRSATKNEANVNNLNLVTGVNSNGNIAGVFLSDDTYYEVLPGAKSASSKFGSVVEFETTSPVNMPNSIQFDLESQVNTPNVEQIIELYDFEEEIYVAYDTSAGTLTDNTFSAYVTGELINFVEPGTGTIRARVTWRPVGPVLQYPWAARIDQAGFTVSQ